MKIYCTPLAKARLLSGTHLERGDYHKKLEEALEGCPQKTQNY
jgi:hypothetical protein